MRERNQRGMVRPAVIVVGAVLGLVALIVGVYVIKWYTADVRGAVDQREKTLADGDYRIAQYDHFYDLCASIQAKESALDTNDAREVSADFSQGMKDANTAALQNVRSSAIAQYNADSHKADTAAHFKASDLPYEISLDLYDPKVGNKTTCSA